MGTLNSFVNSNVMRNLQCIFLYNCWKDLVKVSLEKYFKFGTLNIMLMFFINLELPLVHTVRTI